MRGLVFAALLLVLGSGCVHITELRQPDDSLLVEINTTGWFLFDLLPIATGDLDGGCAWFRDNCVADTNLKVIDRIVEREQATKIGPIVSHETDEGILLFLLNRHGFHTSAVLSK